MIPKKIVTTFARRGKAASFTKPLNLPCQGTIACIIFNRTLCIPGGDNHNQFPPPKGRSDAIVGSNLVAFRVSVWTEVKDENSGLTYWWNEETDETTEVGAAKPMTYSISQDPWIEVKDPQTDQVVIYYWNQITDETTAIGEPKPDPTYGRQHTLPVHAEEYIDPKKHMIVKLRDNERDRETCGYGPQPEHGGWFEAINGLKY
eukprot:jgi/Bigna1/84467/fgenesh1_pg.140_\